MGLLFIVMLQKLCQDVT
ncbi:hypothetical protein MTR67_039590 [Solanum verrucosum]|uniref:Uncharacterized protein n=1 Tax=Solanum verrucosum TaxID=315347 RepID=A0AAF0ZQU8_SOLVR|nr:hypothetical protein MTR67_039590 [Solanum verrucosum]